MKTKEILTVALLIAVLLLASGQEGCPQQGTETQSGIDFTLIPGVSMLSQGKILEKNEVFLVGIQIQNYNEKAYEGMFCIRDNLDDGFGGIPSENEGDCKTFSVEASEMLSEQTQQPGTDNLYFPEASGSYVYHGLPELNKPYDATLYMSMKYRQESEITGTVTSPDDTQPTMTQESQPIQVAVEKTVFSTGNEYKINLELQLVNSQQVSIYSPDLSEKNKIYFAAEMKPLDLQCTDAQGNAVSGLIEFKNEKIIKCFALTSSKTSQSYPLRILLDYGVSLDKELSFSIKTK